MLPGTAPGRMSLLNLAIAPGRPNQARRLAAREPSLARLAAHWHRDCNLDRAEPLSVVMVDGRAQLLELAPGGGLAAAMARIGAAQLAADIGERHCAEIIEQLVEARAGFVRARMLRRDVAAVQRNDVGYRDGSK